MHEDAVRSEVPEAPRGRGWLKWMGPGLLWMVSSVGSGSVLFTPRIGSQYEYALLWLALIVCFFMWVMIREAARYTVVTGRTLLDGFHDLPGPSNWAVWIIFVPQWVAAIAGVGGLSALVGSAFEEAFGGSYVLYTTATIALSCGLVVSGRYRGVERVAQLLAFVLIAVAIAAAGKVFSSASAIGQGLVPSVPDDADVSFIIPWVGTILAGSMGIIWFSYWTATRGYGGGVVSLEEDGHEVESNEGNEGIDESRTERRDRRVHAWMRVTSSAAALGVVSGAIVLVAFLVLGSELLAPEGIVPEGTDVAKDLSRLLSEVWGQFGYWIMIAGIVIALGGSIVANQDGWGRSFADMTFILLRRGADSRGDRIPSGGDVTWFDWISRRLPVDLARRQTLKNAYVVTLTGVLPLLVFYVVRDPVKIMSASGIVAAIHTPFIVFTTLFVNYTRLPRRFRPGWFMIAALATSGLFYLGFAIVYLLQLAGVNLPGSS